MPDYTPANDANLGVPLDQTARVAIDETHKRKGDIIAYRTHAIYDLRKAQLKLNQLAFDGGRPYIDARLSRFPSEAEVDWNGQSIGQDQCKVPSEGRKARATLSNYVQRIIGKIGQYVFSTEIARHGSDPAFTENVTKTGVSVDEFMLQVLNQINLHKWCWVQVDMPMKLQGQTMAEKQARKARPYWQLWTATDVVDWVFDPATGEITRLIVEYREYNNADITQEPTEKTYREVFLPTQWAKYEIVYQKDNGGEWKAIEQATAQIDGIPVILCGYVSPKPHWVDDLERCQRSQMDLVSCFRWALYNMPIGQPVLPQSMGYDQEGQSQPQSPGNRTSEMKRKIGQKYPILESDLEKGISRFISPDMSQVTVMRDEVNQGKAEIFEMVGLGLAQETRQVASAEAKAWDHMDPEAVLRSQATMLEDIERRAVIKTKELDPSFKEWEPVYGKKFDISDFAMDVKALIEIDTGVALPEKARAALILKPIATAIAKRFNVDPKILDEAVKEIESTDPDLLKKIVETPFNPPQFG